MFFFLSNFFAFFKEILQKTVILIWLIVFTFGLLVTNISHTAPLDPKTVEFAYLFDEGKGTVAKDISERGCNLQRGFN